MAQINFKTTLLFYIQKHTVILLCFIVYKYRLVWSGLELIICGPDDVIDYNLSELDS